MRLAIGIRRTLGVLAMAGVAGGPLVAAPPSAERIETLERSFVRAVSESGARPGLRSPAPFATAPPTARATAPTPDFFSTYLEPQLVRRISDRAPFIDSPVYESARALGTSAYGELVDRLERDAERALRRATRRYLVEVSGLDDVALSLRPAREREGGAGNSDAAETQIRLGFSRGLPRLVLDREAGTGALRLTFGADGRAGAEYRPRAGGDARLAVSWDVPEASGYFVFAAGF